MTPIRSGVKPFIWARPIACAVSARWARRDASRSIQWSISCRGTTREWPGRSGRLDRKTTHRSSFHTNRAGSLPSMIWVKIVGMGQSENSSLKSVSGPAVELTGASKRYGDVLAVDNVTLAINAGELVAMLGPNGAGKTTSIHLMLGLRNPTAGKARLFGLDPKDLKARSRIGVMLQESGVPGMLRVEELVRLFCSYYPRPLPVVQAIAMAGLEEKATTLVKDLSGGQHQRLYLALALCGDPEVLFLDEPTVGMDVEGRRRFLQEIGDLGARGRTIVLTTHYLEEADQLAQRVIVIDRGHVIADSSPAQIKARVAGKRITFTTTQQTDENMLAGLPLNSQQVDDHRVRLLTNEPEAVLRELFRRGVEMRDLEVSGADLEEAFVAMTHHEARA